MGFEIRQGIERLKRLSLLPLLSLLALVTAGFGAEGRVLFRADSFVPAAGAALPEGWTTFGPLEAARPEFGVAEAPNLGGPGSLSIYGAAGQAATGCWRTVVRGLTPGAWYRFEAFFQGRGVAWPRRQAMARLYWLDGQGQRVDRPEFVPESGPLAEWQEVSGLFRAPEKAEGVRIELFLSHCPQGTVYWDRVSLSEAAAPPSRLVKVAAANCRPDGAKSNLAQAEQFIGVIEQAGRQGCDILLLGETITLPARGDTPTLEKAEPIPGPITERFGELARQYKMYIIVGLLENDHGTLYNTAALIDRQGKIAGRYRKVFLPLDDLESGVTPGDHYPVFDTDFGRIGIIICYDIAYPEPARAMAVQGAELVFNPNWGNYFPVAARAMENQVYLVSSGYDTPTDIYDPSGKKIAACEQRPGVAVAEIDLNQARYQDGRRRQYLLRELRPDIRVSGLER